MAAAAAEIFINCLRQRRRRLENLSNFQSSAAAGFFSRKSAAAAAAQPFGLHLYLLHKKYEYKSRIKIKNLQHIIHKKG
jgi:hypothetical protein